VADILLQMDAIEGSLRAIRRLLLETELEALLEHVSVPSGQTRDQFRANLVAFLEFSGRDG